jgi:hypothetical protein
VTPGNPPEQAFEPGQIGLERARVLEIRSIADLCHPVDTQIHTNRHGWDNSYPDCINCVKLRAYPMNLGPMVSSDNLIKMIDNQPIAK